MNNKHVYACFISHLKKAGVYKVKVKKRGFCLLFSLRRPNTLSHMQQPQQPPRQAPTIQSSCQLILLWSSASLLAKVRELGKLRAVLGWSVLPAGLKRGMVLVMGQLRERAWVALE